MNGDNAGGRAILLLHRSIDAESTKPGDNYNPQQRNNIVDPGETIDAVDKLTHMAVFARVVESRSFSAAAERLQMSKSAVSKQVARLEAALGVRLLNRTTRQLSLTEAGSAVYRHCANLVAEAEAAEQVASQLHAAPRGTLRVAVPAAFGHLHVAPAIPSFLRRFPDLKVDLEMTERIVDLAEEGQDLAIRIRDEPAPTQIARRLAPLRWVVCATPGYLAQHGLPGSPAELARHNCLHYAVHEEREPWRFDSAHGPAEVAAAGDFRVNNSEAIREVVLQHHGIALLPTFVVWQDLKAGRLQHVLADCTPRTRFGSHIHASYLPSRYVSPKIRAFVDFLVEHIGAPPYWDCWDR